MNESPLHSNESVEESVQRAWDRFALTDFSEMELAQHEIATLRDYGEDQYVDS